MILVFRKSCTLVVIHFNVKANTPGDERLKPSKFFIIFHKPLRKCTASLSETLRPLLYSVAVPSQIRSGRAKRESKRVQVNLSIYMFEGRN